MSGRRNARVPNDSTNCAPHVASVAVQEITLDSFLTALSAMVVAPVAACSTSSAVGSCNLARFSKPLESISCGMSIDGNVTPGSKLVTVALYSFRVSRRICTPTSSEAPRKSRFPEHPVNPGPPPGLPPMMPPLDSLPTPGSRSRRCIRPRAVRGRRAFSWLPFAGSHRGAELARTDVGFVAS